MRVLRMVVPFALAGLLAAAPAASGASLTPRSAAGFRDSVGVNTHVVYFDTAYGDWTRVVQRLDDLGIAHLRDGVFGNPAPNWHDWNERFFRDVDLAVAHGKRFDFLMGYPGSRTGSIDDLATVLKGRLRPAAESLEGPNEFDNSGTSDWRSPLRAYLRTLHDRVKGDPQLRDLPLVGPSFALGASRDQMGPVDGLDLGNLHPYAGGLSPSREHVTNELDQSSLVSGDLPTYATEAGFHNATAARTGQPAVPEDVAAVYTLRTLLEHYGDGIRRTYLYELIDEKPNTALDDPEQHFGLLRNDFSLKPAAVALQNLMRVVGQPAPGALRPVDVTVAGDTAGVRQLLLQDGTGHYRLVLWQTGDLWDVNRRVRLDLPARRLRVALPATAVSATRPVLSSDSHPLAVGGGRVHVDLGADPVVLDFNRSGASGSSAQSAPSSPCGCAPVAGVPPTRSGAARSSQARHGRPVIARVDSSHRRRSDRIVVRLCPKELARLRAELGVRRGRSARFHRLARAGAARSAACRVTVKLPTRVRAAAARQHGRLVVRLIFRSGLRRQRTTVDLVVPRVRAGHGPRVMQRRFTVHARGPRRAAVRPS